MYHHQENVFYYIYDNVAMVVLNSNYWYSYALPEKTYIGGNLHGRAPQQTEHGNRHHQFLHHGQILCEEVVHPR